MSQESNSRRTLHNAISYGYIYFSYCLIDTSAYNLVEAINLS